MKNIPMVAEKRKRRPNWTDAEILENAKNFTSRWDWQRSSTAYGAAYNRGMLDIACAHMIRKIDAYTGLGVIYAYRFNDMSAYVGLTVNPKARRRAHLIYGPVFRKMQTGIPYEYLILENCPGCPDKRVEREAHWMRWHSDNGWKLINTKAAGASGTVATRWTIDRIKSDALRFKTKGEWRRKSGVAYSKALSLGLMESLCGHMVTGYTRENLWTPNKIKLGQSNGSSKLTNASVLEIRRLSSLGESSYIIAPKFGVNPTTISRVVSGKHWRLN